jgi:hypothetical protein
MRYLTSWRNGRHGKPGEGRRRPGETEGDDDLRTGALNSAQELAAA